VFVKMELIQKQLELNELEFRENWKRDGLAKKTKAPALPRYHQNIITDRKQLGIDYTRSSFDFAGIGEYWFDSLTEEPTNLGSPSVTALQNIVIPEAVVEPTIKRMSTLKRRPDVSPSRFKSEWFELHATLVKRIPGVKGYNQNLVIGRTRADGTHATYDELPIDGFVELWFTDKRSLEAAFATGSGKTLMTHALEFIGEISTFLVEPIAIN
jgi:uncharacterized protein (TIGR02118 family)